MWEKNIIVAVKAAKANIANYMRGYRVRADTHTCCIHFLRVIQRLVGLLVIAKMTKNGIIFAYCTEIG